MKNYLNICKTLSLLVVAVTVACSSDDSENEPIDPDNTEFKFLSTIISDDYSGDLKYVGKDTLVYENGKILKSFHNAGCNTFIYQYEYGSNQKVSTIYTMFFLHDPQNSEELIEAFENSTINENYYIKETLTYDNDNKLKRKASNNGHESYEYDDKGRLYKISRSHGSSWTVLDFDEKGNALSTKYVSGQGGSAIITTYVYGDLNNPSYALFQKYGINPSSCLLSEGMISPNVISSSANSYSTWTYIYSSMDGSYPESMFSRSGNIESNYSFTYQ